MSDPTPSGEETSDRKQYWLAALRSRQRLEKAIEGRVETTTTIQQAVVDDQHDFLKEVLSLLDMDGGSDPKQLLQQGLQAMEQIQARAFVLQNMLEAVKRGESLTRVTGRFHRLGLIKVDPQQLVPKPAAGRKENGKLLSKLLASLRKVAAFVIEFIVNVLKAAPEFIEVEPIVGTVGLVPSVSFNLKAESKSLADFLKIFTEAVGV